MSEPRSAPRLVHLYQRTVGDLWRPEVTGGKSRAWSLADASVLTHETDRRRVAWVLSGRLSQADGAQRVVWCKWLRDAVFRWLVGACRGYASCVCYARRVSKWIHDSGRRTLSAQCETRPWHLVEWLTGLEAAGLSARTVAGYRDVVSSFLSWLVDHGLMAKTPVTRQVRRCVRVDPARVVRADGTRQALTLAEGRRLAGWALSVARPVEGFGVLLQASAGLRSCEVARLDRRHLTEAEGVWWLVVPGKGKKQRKIVLEPVVVQAWRRYAQACRRRGSVRGALLVPPGGGRYSPRQVQRWAKLGAVAVGRGADVASHDLRATAATLRCERGAELAAVQRFLGHSSPELTERCYVRRTPPLLVGSGLGDGIGDEVITAATGGTPGGVNAREGVA